MTRIDKAQLCKEFNLYNEARRQLKWTTVKEILLNNGYIIKKVKPVINGKQVNCEIIKNRDRKLLPIRLKYPFFVAPLY